MLASVILVALCASNAVYSKQVDFSIFAKPCPRNAEDYAECTRHALQQSWQRIVAGVPELNIPPLDPLMFEPMAASTEFGSAKATYNVSNMVAYGMANAKFLSVEPTVYEDRVHVDAKLLLPKFLVETDYEGEGGFNQFIVHGKGHLNVSVTDVTAKVILDGPIVDDRWMIDAIDVTPKIGGMKLWASDLFNGNKAFTEAIVAFFNDNWESLYEIGQPIVKERLNFRIKELFQKIFAEIPVSKIFP